MSRRWWRRTRLTRAFLGRAPRAEEISTTRRVLALRWGSIAVAAILILRLGQLQILQHDDWAFEARRTRMRKVVLAARRGTIVDRAGRVIARDRRSYDLVLDISHLIANCPPVTLAEILNHTERARGARSGIVALGEVLGDPRWAVERLLGLRGEDLRRVEDPLARRELWRWGWALLGRGGTASGGEIDRELLVRAFKGQLAARLDQALPLDADRLAATLATWRERFERLEDLTGVDRDSFAAFIDAYRQRYANRPALWRRKRNWARTWVRDVPYDPAIAFLDLHRGDYPGLRIEARMRREYSSDAAVHIIGWMGAPNGDQVRAYDEAQARLRELCDQLHRSAAQQRELETLLQQSSVEAYWPSDVIGRDGLEKIYEHELRGTRGCRLAEWDRRLGAPREEGGILERAPVAGQELDLTLDMELQALAEELLRRTDLCATPLVESYAQYASDPRAAMVLMDARDGSVLVLATTPTYKRSDLRERYRELIDAEREPGLPLWHRAFHPPTVPQPGSVFKPFVALALLRDLGIDPLERLHCSGSYKGQRCNARWGHGDMDLIQALARSCNVYFYRRGEELGFERLVAMAREFGFGTRTGIEVLHESPGRLIEPEHPGLIRARSFAIGQNVPEVTPLQIARAYAGLATGYMPWPHLVRAIGGRPAQLGRRVRIAQGEGDLELIRRALRQTIEGAHGTAQLLRDVPLQIAGKTGTAELARGIPDHAWFAGFFPLAAPRYVIVVFCERAGVHGGQLAVPIARSFLLSEQWRTFEAREHPAWRALR